MSRYEIVLTVDVKEWSPDEQREMVRWLSEQIDVAPLDAGLGGHFLSGHVRPVESPSGSEGER